MTDKENEVKQTDTFTESEIQEVLSLMVSLDLHEDDMRNAILNRDEDAMKNAYGNMRHDLDKVALWLYGWGCTNITEGNNVWCTVIMG